MNKTEHNDDILREIRNRIMMEIWSIIPTSLVVKCMHLLSTYYLLSAYTFLVINHG